jgi:hypothetical protein
LRQPQDGAQLSAGLPQAQDRQVQGLHLQASFLLFSAVVMVTSLVLVADEDRSNLRTMVRSQAWRT